MPIFETPNRTTLDKFAIYFLNNFADKFDIASRPTFSGYTNYSLPNSIQNFLPESLNNAFNDYCQLPKFNNTVCYRKGYLSGNWDISACQPTNAEYRFGPSALQQDLNYVKQGINSAQGYINSTINGYTETRSLNDYFQEQMNDPMFQAGAGVAASIGALVGIAIATYYGVQVAGYALNSGSYCFNKAITYCFSNSNTKDNTEEENNVNSGVNIPVKFV